jgi:tetratricopeptide (TPR) repeat protein
VTRLGPAFLALVLAIGLGGCKTDQDRRDEHLARADAYLTEGKVKEAVLELRNALQRDPQNPAINLEIARILEKTERVSDAFFFYEEAHRLAPEDAEAALGVARLGAFEDTDRAVAVVEELLAREPGDARAHAQRSQLHLIQLELESALAAALTALELAPDDPAALLQLGRVHQARIVQARNVDEVEPVDEIYESAIGAFSRAAEGGTPDQALAALLERARVFATWPEHGEDAVQAYRDLVAKSRELERSDFQIRAAAAATTFSRETSNDAFLRWSLEQQLEAQPGRLGAWRELADIAEAEEAGSGAAVLAPLLAESPESAGVHLLYGAFLDSHGQGDAAIAHLESVLGTVADPAKILGALVSMHLSRGELEPASTWADRLRKDHGDSPEMRFASAQLALEAGEVAEAIEILTHLGTETEDADVYRLLAQAELRAGRPGRATAAVDRALELAGEPSMALLLVEARVAYAAGAWRRVIATFNAIQARGQELRAREYLMTARAYFGAGRPGRGFSILGDLALLDRPYVPAVIELVDRAPERAEEFVRERLDVALEQNPGNPNLLVAYATLDVRSGEDERALERLGQALAGGVDARALALRAEVRRRLGDNDGAVDDALLAFQVQPSSANARALATAYEGAGRLDEAIASFEEAAGVGALPADALPVLARLQLAQQRPDAAIATYEEALAKRPGATGVKNDLAFLLAEAGSDLDRALVLAQEAQSEAPELSPIADTLGFVYLKKAMLEPAERQFRYAIELQGTQDPTPGYHYHLGLVLGEQGRHAEAVEAFEAALALETEFPEAEETRRQLEAARAALEKVASS